MTQLKKVYLMAALAISTSAVLFQNCAAAPPPDVGQLTSPSTSPGGGFSGGGGAVAPVASYVGCQQSGLAIAHGASAPFYQTAVMPVGGSCVPENRTCNNGSLSGSYTSTTCTVQSPAATASCSLGNQTIAHGQSITTYGATNVAYGSSCSSVAQVRTCNNGTLSGQYPYTSCVSNCALNGVPVTHGESILAYQQGSLPAGYNCANYSEQRVCNNGTLSGSYTNNGCTVGAATPTPTPTPRVCIDNCGEEFPCGTSIYKFYDPTNLEACR